MNVRSCIIPKPVEFCGIVWSCVDLWTCGRVDVRSWGVVKFWYCQEEGCEVVELGRCRVLNLLSFGRVKLWICGLADVWTC